MINIPTISFPDVTKPLRRRDITVEVAGVHAMLTLTLTSLLTQRGEAKFWYLWESKSGVGGAERLAVGHPSNVRVGLISK